MLIELGGMMHFLLRSTQTAADQPQAVTETYKESNTPSKPVTTLQGLISEESSQSDYTTEDREEETQWFGIENGCIGASKGMDWTSSTDKHVDVTEDQGWITIPRGELSSNWSDAPDMQWFRSMDRSFVFPGEQVHIVACLSASKQDTEIITPFKVAAILNKNAVVQGIGDQNGTSDADSTINQAGEVASDGSSGSTNDNSTIARSRSQKDVSAGESLLRMEDHRRQTQTMMQKFEDSHFFVRIADFGEPLWSKRGGPDAPDNASGASVIGDSVEAASSATSLNAVIDKGKFDARVSGGVARNSVKCHSLSNGDMVVLLEVNVGVDFLKDPMLEILQFEKYEDKVFGKQNEQTTSDAEHDPCGELLKWLLPLDNLTLPPLSRALTPPLAGMPYKASFSGSTGSQLFSFGHFRSYSMSSVGSVSSNTSSVSSTSVASSSSRPSSFDLGDWERTPPQKLVRSQKVGSEGLLSFRGVPLEPERFSVRCGLEGIYIPGRRWRRRVEIIQPIDIHTFAADCNTEDFLCVQLKNVSPAHTPEIIVYVDAISIIFEEASKFGPPSTIPIACIEAGTDHNLPNLALRQRGEEHSFILKPATSLLNPKMHGGKISQPSHSKAGNWLASVRVPPTAWEGKKNVSSDYRYAILVSCRCNYTESRLFFKKPTTWQPRISRDLMISVASEMSNQALEHEGKVPQLPVQVLTLQASNLTSEELTLTILAPTTFASSPSLVSLNSPSTPRSPFVGFSTTQRLSSIPLLVENSKQSGDRGAQSVSFDDQAFPISDVIPTTALACNHLWLQSRVPLGCIPPRSTSTVKLELLPLTDGIITLDTLQINVKEKGTTYVPEHSLKINATSSIATGIV
ncbi:hypothetical protein AKJ16_DCAP03975 [Drosera capensis]